MITRQIFWENLLIKVKFQVQLSKVRQISNLENRHMKQVKPFTPQFELISIEELHKTYLASTTSWDTHLVKPFLLKYHRTMTIP